MWKGKLERVPKEHKKDLCVEFSLEEGYKGEHFVVGTLWYKRLETNEEYRRRLERETKEREAQEAWEIQELARLTEKYKGRTL